MTDRLRAHEVLSAWLAANGRSQSWLAKTLGIGQPSVSSWCRGANIPEPKFRRALAFMLGEDEHGQPRLPVEAWLTDDERAEQARLERVARDVQATGTDGT